MVNFCPPPATPSAPRQGCPPVSDPTQNPISCQVGEDLGYTISDTDNRNIGILELTGVVDPSNHGSLLRSLKPWLLNMDYDSVILDIRQLRKIHPASIEFYTRLLKATHDDGCSLAFVAGHGETKDVALTFDGGSESLATFEDMLSAQKSCISQAHRKTRGLIVYTTTELDFQKGNAAYTAGRIATLAGYRQNLAVVCSEIGKYYISIESCIESVQEASRMQRTHAALIRPDKRVMDARRKVDSDLPVYNSQDEFMAAVYPEFSGDLPMKSEIEGDDVTITLPGDLTKVTARRLLRILRSYGGQDGGENYLSGSKISIHAPPQLVANERLIAILKQALRIRKSIGARFGLSRDYVMPEAVVNVLER